MKVLGQYFNTERNSYYQAFILRRACFKQWKAAADHITSIATVSSAGFRKSSLNQSVEIKTGKVHSAERRCCTV